MIDIEEELSKLSPEEWTELIKRMVGTSAKMQNSLLQNLEALREKKRAVKSNPWDRDLGSWIQTE